MEFNNFTIIILVILGLGIEWIVIQNAVLSALRKNRQEEQNEKNGIIHQNNLFKHREPGT